MRIQNHEKKLGRVISGRATDSAEAKKVVQECRDSYNKIVMDETIQNKKEYKDLKWSTPTKLSERD